MRTKIHNPKLLIAAVALGILLNPLNTTMISVAFARLEQVFHLTFYDISWLIATYYLASAIAQPVMGKLSDMFGGKRIFLLGLSLVTVSSILAPFSPSFGWLIAFRIIQAIGTSANYPAGMAIIRHAITENQAKALGILSIFGSTAAAFGPTIGGVLIHYGDWPAIFLINFPIILVSFLLSLKVLPNDSVRPKGKIRMDFSGIALFSLAIFGWLFFFLSIGKQVNWWVLGAAIVVSVIFYRYENRTDQPFVDVRFLRNHPQVTHIFLQYILLNTIHYSMMFGIPSYLQNVRHFDTQHTGFLMLSISGFGVLATMPAARWMDREGTRAPLMTGMLIMVLATLLLLTISDGSASLWIFAVLSVFGISSGIGNLGLQTSLLENIQAAETGIASGLFMTARYIGTILSSSLLGTLFAGGMTTGLLHTMAFVCIGVSVIMYVLSFRKQGKDRVQDYRKGESV